MPTFCAINSNPSVRVFLKTGQMQPRGKYCEQYTGSALGDVIDHDAAHVLQSDNDIDLVGLRAVGLAGVQILALPAALLTVGQTQLGRVNVFIGVVAFAPLGDIALIGGDQV